LTTVKALNAGLPKFAGLQKFAHSQVTTNKGALAEAAKSREQIGLITSQFEGMSGFDKKDELKAFADSLTATMGALTETCKAAQADM